MANEEVVDMSCSRYCFETVSKCKRKRDEMEFLSSHFDQLYTREGRFTFPEKCHCFEKSFLQRRNALINWIFSLIEDFKYSRATLFLAASIADLAFLRMSELEMQQFQVLGAACLMVAAKMEEISAPSLSCLVDICEHTFDGKNLAAMEAKLLEILEFDVNAPTSLDFANLLAVYFDFSPKEQFLGSYLLELALFDIRLNTFTASHKACAAAHLVLQITRFRSQWSWSSDVASFTRYEECDLKSLVEVMRNLHFHAWDSQWLAPSRYYQADENLAVSLIPPLRQSELQFGSSAFSVDSPSCSVVSNSPEKLNADPEVEDAMVEKCLNGTLQPPRKVIVQPGSLVVYADPSHFRPSTMKSYSQNMR